VRWPNSEAGPASGKVVLAGVAPMLPLSSMARARTTSSADPAA
jgi:hypothetical protein